MGLIIKRRVETNKGFFDSLYVRIEFIRIEKFTGKIYLSPSFYESEEIAKLNSVWSRENTIEKSIKLDNTNLEISDFEIFSMISEEQTEMGKKNRIDTSITDPSVYSWSYNKLKESYKKIFGEDAVIDC